MTNELITGFEGANFQLFRDHIENVCEEMRKLAYTFDENSTKRKAILGFVTIINMAALHCVHCCEE